jgi:hypothetical protein
MQLAFEAWRHELHLQGGTVLNNLIIIYGNTYNYLIFTGL